MIPIFLASVLVIVMPVAAQAPIPGRTAIAMGLGFLAIEATWAAHRFRCSRPRSRRASRRE